MKVPLVPEIPLVSVPSVRDDDRRARESPCEMAFSRRGRACLNARVMWNRSGLVQVLLFSGLVQVLLLLQVAEFALVRTQRDTRMADWQRRTAVAGPQVQHTIKTKHLERCLLWNTPTSSSANMVFQAFVTV